MPLVEHPEGGYHFLPGIAPYSCGAVSSPGFEVVHVTFQRPEPYRAGFERVARFLKAAGRPRAALCGIELRSPSPFSFPGFAEFNAGYQEILRDWGVFVGGINPVARTNVAPALSPPQEPVLYGFSYATPAANDAPPTFVVAGAGELPEGVLTADAIVAAGDVSPQGIRTKAAFVMDLMEARLRGLGAGWPTVSSVDVYTIHPLREVLRDILLTRIGTGGIHGVNWYYSRPPIQDIEYEMDVRGVRTEFRIGS